MEEVPANTGKVYIFNGYIYVLNKVNNNTRYFKCRTKWCRSRVVCTNTDDEEPPRPSPHNHPADVAEVEQIRFRHDIKVRARTASNNPKDLFNETSER